MVILPRFLEFKDFIQRCHDSVNKIALHADTIGVLLGCPSYNEVPEGKDLFNSAYLLYNQQIQDVVHKTLLPTYDVFDEYRYFEPAFQWHVMTFKGKNWRLLFVKIYGIWAITHCIEFARWMNSSNNHPTS